MITFSSEQKKFARKDLDETSMMAEKYFGMEKDPNQIPATKENRNWIYKNLSNYVNIIKNNDKIIGFVFVIPCDLRLMKKFVDGKINESELFENVKKIELKNPKAIYLCSAFVNEKFRGKNLATSAMIKTIKNVTSNGRNKPVLFYWKYSSDGEKLSKKISNLTGLDLVARK